MQPRAKPEAEHLHLTEILISQRPGV
jgi:hypothetical protein